jgi:hypothetical protein
MAAPDSTQRPAPEKFWSPHYIQHSAHIPPGREGLFDLVRAAPPTLRYENSLIFAQGDDVMLHGCQRSLGYECHAGDTQRFRKRRRKSSLYAGLLGGLLRYADRSGGELRHRAIWIHAVPCHTGSGHDAAIAALKRAICIANGIGVSARKRAESSRRFQYRSRSARTLGRPQPQVDSRAPPSSAPAAFRRPTVD